MYYVFSGLAVIGSSAAGLWYFLPRNGKINPLVVLPVLDWLIPVAIVSALALGTALIMSGLLS